MQFNVYCLMYLHKKNENIQILVGVKYIKILVLLMFSSNKFYIKFKEFVHVKKGILNILEGCLNYTDVMFFLGYIT